MVQIYIIFIVNIYCNLVWSIYIYIYNITSAWDLFPLIFISKISSLLKNYFRYIDLLLFFKIFNVMLILHENLKRYLKLLKSYNILYTCASDVVGNF